MAKIKKDFLGIYTIAGGYIVKPVQDTRFKIDDEVTTHHFGGSCIAGIGKDGSCKHGEYLEYWSTFGIDSMDYRTMNRNKIKKQWKWYLDRESFHIKYFAEVMAKKKR